MIIPVRNEQTTIETTLRALVEQRDLHGQPLDRRRYEIIVLANNCTDATAALVRRFAARQPTLALDLAEITLPAPIAHVGMARRIAMDQAYRRLIGLGRARGVIASTDGDTRVTPTWIATTLDAIHQGADAVGGRIVT